MRLRALASWSLLGLFWVSPAQAQEPPARVSVLTMGPGDHPFTRFGHDALLLEWDGAGPPRDIVYNFGTFEFDGARGVTDFMAGRFRYWLSTSTLSRTLHGYGAARRSLVAQELELSAAQRSALAAALAENALPQNRYYDYDYYRDNCSTRLRDALDRVLDGQLATARQAPGRLTFRQHTLRLVADAPWLYLGLDLALGAATDRPTTRHDELFLPQQLRDQLASTQVEQGGRRLPLVRAERQLLSSQRAAVPLEPPDRRLPFAAVGLVLGVGLASLGRAAARSRGLRLTFGALTALLGIAAGLLGCVMASFWAFSKHWAAHRNYSLLLCPPWALLLALFGVALLLGRFKANLWLARSTALILVSSGLALLLSLIPGSGHASPELPLLFLPVWLGVLLGARGAATHRSER